MHREGLGGNFRKVAATDGTILALHVRRNSGQCLAQFLVRATDVRELFVYRGDPGGALP